jgi:hypothetical protein
LHAGHPRLQTDTSSADPCGINCRCCVDFFLPQMRVRRHCALVSVPLESSSRYSRFTITRHQLALSDHHTFCTHATLIGESKKHEHVARHWAACASSPQPVGVTSRPRCGDRLLARTHRITTETGGVCEALACTVALFCAEAHSARHALRSGNLSWPRDTLIRACPVVALHMPANVDTQYLQVVAAAGPNSSPLAAFPSAQGMTPWQRPYWTRAQDFGLKHRKVQTPQPLAFRAKRARCRC